MSKTITYIIEVTSAYDGLEDAISKLDFQKKPLYIAKDEDDSGAVLEYIADIKKINVLPRHLEIHNKKEIK